MTPVQAIVEPGLFQEIHGERGQSREVLVDVMDAKPRGPSNEGDGTRIFRSIRSAVEVESFTSSALRERSWGKRIASCYLEGRTGDETENSVEELRLEWNESGFEAASAVVNGLTLFFQRKRIRRAVELDWR
jgi:hypothetical protein